MDLRRLRAGEWITALAGLVLVASLWLPWWSQPGAAELDAWASLTVLDGLLCALGVAAAGLLALTAAARGPGPGLIADTLLAPVAFAFAIACLVRVLNAPGDLDPGAATELGGWVGFGACLAIAAGAAVAMRDERLSRPGRPTDQTGAPLARALEVERLPGPPPA